MIAVSYKHTMAGAKPLATPPLYERRNRVAALSRAYQARNAVQRAEEARRQIIEAQTPSARLISMVAFWHGVTVSDIKGQDRHAKYREARFDAIEAVYRLCRTEKGERYSLLRLGRIFGGRDHSTIHNALSKRGVRCAKDGRQQVRRAADG